MTDTDIRYLSQFEAEHPVTTRTEIIEQLRNLCPKGAFPGSLHRPDVAESFRLTLEDVAIWKCLTRHKLATAVEYDTVTQRRPRGL